MSAQPERKRYANTGKVIIDQRELLRMLEEGLKKADIARHYGVTSSAVTKSIKRMAA